MIETLAKANFSTFDGGFAARLAFGTVLRATGKHAAADFEPRVWRSLAVCFLSFTMT
jgi:hypothetical protein